MTRCEFGMWHRADPSQLFLAIEAEAAISQVEFSDWDTRIEYMERVIGILKERILQRRLQRFEEEIKKEAASCSMKKEIRR